MELQEAITTGVGALGAIAAAFYGVKRKLTADANSDKLDGKATQLIERLEAQITQDQSRIDQLTTAIERVSSERNEAVQQVGRMDATIHALEKEVERLRLELQDVELANRTLLAQSNDMTTRLNDMAQKMDNLITINERLIQIIQTR